MKELKAKGHEVDEVYWYGGSNCERIESRYGFNTHSLRYAFSSNCERIERQRR